MAQQQLADSYMHSLSRTLRNTTGPLIYRHSTSFCILGRHAVRHRTNSGLNGAKLCEINSSAYRLQTILQTYKVYHVEHTVICRQMLYAGVHSTNKGIIILYTSCVSADNWHPRPIGLLCQLPALEPCPIGRAQVPSAHTKVKLPSVP